MEKLTKSMVKITINDKEAIEAKDSLMNEFAANFSEPLFEKCVRLLDYLWIKPSFRPNQAKYVLIMAYRMACQENIILQAPTGTGKTTMGITAAIIGAIQPVINDIGEIINRKDASIFFAGRTLTQSERVIEEMAEFNATMGRGKAKFVAVQLNAKARMCLFQDVIENDDSGASSDPDDEDVENAVFGIHGRCSKARQDNACPYFPKDQIDNYAKAPLSPSVSGVAPMFLYFRDKMVPYIQQAKLQMPFKASFNGDMLRRFGQSINLCPYYLMFGVVQLADFVAAPYIWINEPRLRDFLFSLMQFSKKFIIIDEAHNFPEDCSEKGKVNFSRFRLNYLIKKAAEHEKWYATDLMDKDLQTEKLFAKFGADLIHFMQIMDRAANEMKAAEIGKGKSFQYSKGVLNMTEIVCKNRGTSIHSEIMTSMKLKPMSNTTEDKTFFNNLFENLINRIDEINQILTIKKEKFEREGKDNPVRASIAESIERDIRRFESMKDFFEIKEQKFLDYLASSYSMLLYLNQDESNVDKSGKPFPITWNLEWHNYNPAESTFDLFSPEKIHVCGSLGLTGTFHEPTYASKMGFRLKHSPMEWKNPIMQMKTEGRSNEEAERIIPILDQLPPFPFPFDVNNFRARVVQGGNLDFKNRAKYLPIIPIQIASLHSDCIKNGIVKNKLIFLSSKALIYNFKRDLINALKTLNVKNVQIFAENEMKNAEENDKQMIKFKATKNAIWIGVMGGRNSEGADYPPDLLDMVAVVGVPYEAWNSIVKNRIEKYSTLFNFDSKISYDYAYTVPAYMKTGQALGRLIRSNSTKGIILLYDDRFAMPQHRDLFPKWFSKELDIIKPAAGDYQQNIWAEIDGKKLFK